MADNATAFALVGSETLIGREIRDLVGTSAPGIDLRLIETGTAVAATAEHEAPVLPMALNAKSLSGTRGVFLAGSPEANRKAIELAEGEIPLIDLSFAAEERPDARVRAPMVESGDPPAEEGDADEGGGEDGGTAGVHVIAHPAAIALALFLRRLQMHDPIRRSVIQIFVPASEHGAPGVEELQQQTISLLSFKSLPRAVFDTQASFNLLARYGEEAPTPLEETELRIERHLATLLALPGDGEGALMPSLRVLQAPVFHGYSFSAWVEFEGNPGLEAIESGLVAAHIEVRGGEFEPPNNVGHAGQSGIAVGAIAEDRNDPDACWFWVVCDNLRLAAENAVRVARELV
ncbi:MAG TPA: Asd/ArgC dimerization domain-containing protein [Bryobacteraceae bacterium]|nr:Asd/ArgC dimerization domain-containing protein [Bryobacteraceae bacterium]